ncbi:hypothetical protein [Bradyrhizobium canariense]|nr:hypothetical protein [Bradyrhizobium canariense]
MRLGFHDQQGPDRAREEIERLLAQIETVLSPLVPGDAAALSEE